MTKPKVYLAAPLFNPIERDFNYKLTELMENCAIVFLPQRDGALLTNLIASGVSLEASRRQVFEADVRALRECHVVVAVLDGRTIDEGVAFEVGYASALGKICVSYKSDDRVMLPTGDNPMLQGAFRHNCFTFECLLRFLELVRSELDQRGNLREFEKSDSVVSSLRI